MNLFFYGDKQKFIEIEKQIKIFEKRNNKNFNINFYNKLNNFLSDISNEHVDIIFLLHSTEFEDILNLTINIKKINKKHKIIFCSNTNKYALKGYKMELFYYVLFPIEYTELDYIFNKFLDKKENIVVKSNWQKISISINDIHFAEKQGHNVLIHTSNEIISTRTTFKEFAGNFKNKDNFVNCIRGTIVNFDWVLKIVSQNFVMKNGQKIPIRRKDKTKIKDLFFKYNLQKEWIFLFSYIIYIYIYKF